ncbi:hypothetical protein [Anaerorhabdus sp.]|uniref:hypothetical protein n=1 Tax=Anaerorhabdus sp. TaxID=1872524 RepID=UPI002FC9EF16
MNKNILNFYKNIFQLKRLENCKFVLKNESMFLAELEFDRGKYKIIIEYFKNKSPNIYLLKPDITEVVTEHSVEIHTYGMKYHKFYKRRLPLLCLTHPGIDKWNSSISLIRSYIPWTLEWFEFYEIWVMTGIWFGEGVHPSNSKEKESET